MRLVLLDDMGCASLNWTWLPTWIGMNAPLMKELEEELSNLFVGRSATDALLAEADQYVLEFFKRKFTDIEGLPEYLDGIKFVSL